MCKTHSGALTLNSILLPAPNGKLKLVILILTIVPVIELLMYSVGQVVTFCFGTVKVGEKH